jgi:hypothetical protein
MDTTQQLHLNSDQVDRLLERLKCLPTATIDAVVMVLRKSEKMTATELDDLLSMRLNDAKQSVELLRHALLRSDLFNLLAVRNVLGALGETETVALMQEVMVVILDIQSKRATRAKMAARNELRLVLNGNKQDAPGTEHDYEVLEGDGCDDNDDDDGIDNDDDFDDDNDEGYDDDDAVFVLENDDDIVIVDERNAAGQYRILLS